MNAAARGARDEPFAMVAEATRGVEKRARKARPRRAGGRRLPGPSLRCRRLSCGKTPARPRGPRGASRREQRHARRGGRDRAKGGGVQGRGCRQRGYVSTLKVCRRRGRLSDERLLCAAAARIGDLEALKALRRAEIFPWDEQTCRYAARSEARDADVGARERARGTRGSARARRGAATSRCFSGHARTTARGTTCSSRRRRPPRGAEVGARERLPVGR